MNPQNHELAVAKQGLLTRIDRFVPEIGQSKTAVPNLSFNRRVEPTSPTTYIQSPSVCLIAQGAKRILLGKESYTYDANHYLITALDVPVVAQIIEASRERPYLSLVLTLDQHAISQLMVESELSAPLAQRPSRAMTVSELTLPLVSALLRLIDLLDDPETIPVLSPLIQREILYRLMIGEQGPYLRQIGTAGSQGYRISRAVGWLKKHFTEQIHVERLAAYSQMSTSSFHHHFRELTAMTPLQYQKWLRLQEARRLMLAERLDAAEAAFRVGYESPSQFSREYRRMYKVSPARDVKTLLSADTRP